MAHKNGKITAPVSIRDVQLTLGERIGVLAPRRNNGVSYDLCGSPNINIWSRIKPCRYDSLDVMQPHDFTAVADPSDPNKGNVVLSAQTLTPITNGTTGIIFPTMMMWSDAAKLRAGLSVSGLKDQSAAEYRHDYPTGWDGKHYYASRLKDFDGYNHYAPIPFNIDDVSFGGRTFNVNVGLNTNDEGVRAKTFDYNIYKNVIWRLAVAVARKGSESFRLYYMKDEDATKQNQYLYSNGFLGTIGDKDSSYKITGEVASPLTDYVFIGMLIAYKVTQNIGGDDQPITKTVSPIQASPSDNSRCGIPMPCSNVVAKSSYYVASVSFTDIDWMWGLPADGDVPVLGSGDYSIIIKVKYKGGDIDQTLTGLGLAIYISGSLVGTLKIGSVTLAAGEIKNVDYYYLTNRTGVTPVKVVLIKKNQETDTKILKTINITPHN